MALRQWYDRRLDCLARLGCMVRALAAQNNNKTTAQCGSRGFGLSEGCGEVWVTGTPHRVVGVQLMMCF